MRAVVDTGVLVSAFINRRGAPGRVLERIRRGGITPLYSAAMLDELLDVFGRPHFQRKYQIVLEDIETLFGFLQVRGEPVIPQLAIAECRDPKDDKFLAAALAGRAECIISGDEDLRILHPWRGILILSPTEALARLGDVL
jgi:putative PIN family toxin of toxin-antitoxin system